MAEKVHSELDRILPENLAEQGAQSGDLPLQSWDACEELVEVRGRAGHQRNREAVVVHLIILHEGVGAETLYKFLKSLLDFRAQITTSIVDLVDVEEDLECSAQVDSEAAQQRLP